MGQFQGLYESSVMTAADVAAHLLNKCSSLSNFRSYMFGSYLDSVGVDIDILIVGERGQKLVKLKCEIKRAGAELPLHILYMNKQEAAETAFISKHNCLTLHQLANRVRTTTPAP